jgi:hypothetical protein
MYYPCDILRLLLLEVFLKREVAKGNLAERAFSHHFSRALRWKMIFPITMLPSPSKSDTNKGIPEGEKKQKARIEESGGRKRKMSEDTESESSRAQEADCGEESKYPNDGKNWKRIMANRKSAHESRLRRIKYMETLEKNVEALTQENTALLRENSLLARENFALRQRLAPTVMDTPMNAASLHQPSLTMGTQGPFGGAGPGLPPGTRSGGGVARLPPVLSPTRLAASHSALARPVMDLTHPGFGIPPVGSLHGAMPRQMPPVPGEHFNLEMARRRRLAASRLEEGQPTSHWST